MLAYPAEDRRFVAPGATSSISSMMSARSCSVSRASQWWWRLAMKLTGKPGGNSRADGVPKVPAGYLGRVGVAP
jgi:hypothetical protein